MLLMGIVKINPRVLSRSLEIEKLADILDNFKMVEGKIVAQCRCGILLELLVLSHRLTFHVPFLVFDENVSSKNPFLLQTVEFIRLVSSLRPDESEDAIVTSCQKLVAMFRQKPEQKSVFVTQHGFLPLMDLLDIPKSRVICVVMLLLNEIIKDNTDCLENACLVGLEY